ncbi:MAG: hypothetical protein ABIS51_19190 [Sphingomonas sp.]
MILLTIDTLLPVLILPARAALTALILTSLASTALVLTALTALVAALLVLLTVEVLLPILVLPTLIALAALASLVAPVLITHRPSPAVVVRVQDARK